MLIRTCRFLVFFLSEPQHGFQEALGSFVLGVFKDLLGRAFFLDEAVGHEDNPVGDFFSEGHFVGDDDHGHFFVGQLLDGPQDFACQFRVEGRRRFVEQHDVRIHGQGAGDGYALLLAAGQARRVFVPFLPQADLFQQLFRRRHDVFGLHALDDARRFEDVVEDGHMGKEVKVLEAHAHAAADGPHLGRRGVDGAAAAFGLADHDVAVDGNRAAVNGFELAQAAQEGALAAARRADDRDDFAFVDVERHVL